MANLIETDDEVVVPAAKPRNIIEDETPPGYETTQNGLQPKGLIDPTKVKPTSMDQFRNSLTEDARRVKDFVTTAPDKVATGAIQTGLNVMGVDPVRVATRAAGQAMSGQPVTNPMTEEMVAQGYTKPTPGPQVFPDPGYEAFSSPVSSIAKAAINAASQAKPIDVDLGDGASARQMVNYAAHRTTGRVLNWLQETTGKPVAQMMLTVAKMGAEGLHDLTDTPADQPLLSFAVPNDWSNPAAGTTELPVIQGYKQNPELHEHISRTMLETLGGPSVMLPPEQQETARAQMTREWGETGAKVVEGGAQLIGTWPVMMLPGVGQLDKAIALEEAATLEAATSIGAKGLANDVAVGSPTLVKNLLPELGLQAVKQQVKVQAAEGALQSYYLASAKKGSDVGLETGLGGFAGGLFGAAAGMYHARKLPGILGKALYPAVVVDSSSMAQLAKELDQTFARIQPKVRRNVNEPITGPRLQAEGGKQPTYRMGQKVAGEKMAQSLTGPEAPDVDFDLVAGKVDKPSFSKFTFDENGNFVWRDYEIVAGPGRAKRKQDMEVWSDKSGAMRIRRGPEYGPAHSTNVTAKFRDTLVTDAQTANRLANRRGTNLALSAMTDEEHAALDQLLRTTRANSPEMVGGTEDYMAPEQASKWGEVIGWQGGRGATPQRRLDLLNVIQQAKGKRPMVMTLNDNGALNFTEVPFQNAKPFDAVPEVGDNVLVHGQVPGQVVGQMAGGRFIVELAGGERTYVAEVDAVLNTQAPRKGASTVAAEYEVNNPKTGSGPLAIQRRLKDEAARKLNTFTSKPEGGATPEGASVSPRVKAIIQASTDITPQDVLRWEGRGPNDLGWATAALRKLEQANVLRHDGGGRFSPTRPSATLPEDASMGGEFVFIGTGGPPMNPNDPHGSGVVGILRGKDPRAPNNYLVEVPQGRDTMPDAQAGTKYAKTKFVSVPADEVRTMKPVGMADKSKVSPDIDMYGWTKPMPTQFIQASQGAIGDIEEMTKFWSRVAPASLQGGSKAKYEALKEAFGGAMHTAQYNVRTSKAQKMFSSAQVMRGEAMAGSDMLAHKLGGYGSPANLELTKVLESAASRSPNGVNEGIDPAKLAAWSAKYPKESSAAMSDVKNMVAQRDTQSALLIQLGIPQVAAAEAGRGELAAYLTRNYAAFSMPRDEWAKFARKNLTTEWRSLVEYMTSTRPDLDASLHAGNIDTILRLDDPIQGFIDHGYIKADSKAKLREKIEVPAPIRDILGEFKDASTRLAFTVAHQRQLIKGVEGWNAIASHKDLFSPGWRPDMTLPIPDDPLFGNARNGFVRDDASMRHLVEGRKLSTLADSVQFLQAVGWMGQKWKAAHTVWNPVAWANNGLRGLKTLVGSGGFLGPGDFAGFREASAMLKDYANDPTIWGRNRLLVEAMDFDAVGPGLAGSELSSAQKKFQRAVFDHYINRTGKGSTMFDLYTGLRDMALQVPEAVHNGYDSIDKVVKLGCYLNVRRRLIAQGYSVHDAAAISALRVNQSAQNFEPHAIPQWLRTATGFGPFTALAPFASSKVNDVRINGTLVARVMKTLNPLSARHEKEYDLLARLAGFSALVGGAATLANNTRRMNGISDEEDDAQRASIPMRTKQYHPLLLGSLDYDERGRRVFLPVDQVEDLAMSFRGNVNDPALVSFMMNNLLEVVGPQTMTGTGLEAIAGGTGLYTPRDPTPLPRPDQKGLLDTAARLGTPFMPQGAVNLVNTMSPTRRGLIAPESLTDNQKLLHVLGEPTPIPVGPATQAQSNMENASAASKAGTDIKAAATQGALQGVSGDRMKYMIQSNVDELHKKLRVVPRSLKSKEKP